MREVQNVIERAAIRSRDGQLELGLAPNSSTRLSSRRTETRARSALGSLSEIKNHERNLIVEALTKTRGKIYGPDGAATLLGMKPTTLVPCSSHGLKKLIAA